MSEIIRELTGGFLVTMSAIVFAKLVLDTNINKPKWKTILVIGIVSSSYPLTYLTIGGVFSSLLHFIIIIIMFMYLFNIKVPKGIFMSFLHSLLLLVADIIIMIITMYLLKMDRSYLYDKFAGSVWSNMLVCIVFCIITFLIKKPLQKLLKYKMSSNKLISLFTILTIICVAVFFYIGFSNLKIDYALLISVFSMVVFIAVLFGLVKQKIENDKITEKYDSLIEFMKSYEEVIDNQRIYHHENKNQLINIKGKIIDKDKNKNIIEYIDSILNEEIEFSKEKYSKLKYLPSNGFKGLFYYKISKAEDLKIKVSISVSKSIENSLLHKMENNDYKELCRIIGVYLDNAIEASNISNDKLIGIEIYCDEKDICIVISNTYIGEINIQNVNKTGFTTKGKGHGYGLSLVRNILNNNKRFENSTEITETLYIQKLIVKNKIKNQ